MCGGSSDRCAEEVGLPSLSNGEKPTTNCSETEIFARFSEAGYSRKTASVQNTNGN
jgi:hypothetical protein